MSRTPLEARQDRDWMDHVAVELFLTGKNPGRALTLAERQEVARRQHEEWIGKTARALRIRPDIVRDALAPAYQAPPAVAAA